MYGANRRAEKEKARYTSRFNNTDIQDGWEMFRKGLKVGGLKEMKNISSQRFHRK
ncbi:MAG: hypothetical protein ACLUP6_14070 [Anaerostipes hadrus]